MTARRISLAVALTLTLTLVLLSLTLGVAPAGAVETTDTSQPDPRPVVAECAADPPADFGEPAGDTSEVVGWVEGYWYDEPLDIDIEDGLTGTELERLSARTAARVEALRCLTVQDGVPPVDIVPREEFAAQQQSRTVGNTTRLVSNAKFETTLTIDSETDSIDVRQSDSAERVGGSYNYISEKIVIVTDDPEALRIDESTLAEELGHAIQDQHFDISQYDRATVDRDKGILGLIEGDIGYVVDQYLAACEAGQWAEPCLTEESGAGGGAEIANWGVYFEGIQPYSDGPPFVAGVQAEGGWTAVNSLYENPPTSALHTTYPETFDSVEPRNVTVPDRSTDRWERVVLDRVPGVGGPLASNTLGISTITGMFAAPAHEESTDGSIISRRATLNIDESGRVDSFNPHDFAHPETEGWRGDSLYTYRGDNDTATLWELVWATPEDAAPFVESYEQLAEIRGGERVEGYAHTYRFDSESDYDMALTLVPDGNRVTVVTAPNVEALTTVDRELELLSADSADTGDGEPSGDGGTADGGEGDGGGSDGSDNDGPGGGDAGGGDTDTAGDGSENTEFGLLLLTAVGMSFLLVLALLTTGSQRRR